MVYLRNIGCVAVVLLTVLVASAQQIHRNGFETRAPVWVSQNADAKFRVVAHDVTDATAHTGQSCEHVHIQAEQGTFVGPHVFTDIAPTATLAQEEIFGPVLAVLKARDLDEALRIANGTPYALTGGLFSRSPENIRKVKKAFRVGNLYVNRKITGALVDRQPFGGFKLSGIGSKAGGPDYLLQFVLPRTITENTLRRGFAPEAAVTGTEAPASGV